MDVVKQHNWIADYPAFAWCASLGEGWYLPAIEELKRFTLNDAIRNTVNKTLKNRGGKTIFDKGDVEWYWSSTEKYESWAWYVHMDNGYTDFSSKFNLNTYVRAVSAF